MLGVPDWPDAVHSLVTVFVTVVFLFVSCGLVRTALWIAISRHQPAPLVANAPLHAVDVMAADSQQAGLRAGNEWWDIPAADESEAALICNVVSESTTDEGKLQHLRQLRSLGCGATATDLAARMAEVEEWKRANVCAPPICLPGEWPAASDLHDGAWALEYICVGLRCGRSIGGHPVKIERIGLAQTERMEKEAGQRGAERLAQFYFAMIESMQVCCPATPHPFQYAVPMRPSRR